MGKSQIYSPPTLNKSRAEEHMFSLCLQERVWLVGRLWAALTADDRGPATQEAERPKAEAGCLSDFFESMIKKLAEAS